MNEAHDPAPTGAPAPGSKGPASPLVTVVVLTLNEGGQLDACLEAIPPDVSVLVVDAFSTDRTVEIAQSLGAQVEQRAWTGFADQRNFALRECGLLTDWALFIDADERYPAAFFDWLRQTLPTNPPVDAYDVPSRLHLDGSPLRHAPGYPILHPRLTRRSVQFRVNHAGHGEALGTCRTATAPIGYEHYFQDGDLAPWLSKHVRLAQLEATTEGAPVTRRGRLREVAPRGPARAIFRFLYHYLICRGFLDGVPGYRYSLMYAWYELTIDLLRVAR